MFSYTLCKSEVTYMGSSGPGTCRILKIQKGDNLYLLQENFTLSEYKPMNERRPGYPIEVPVTLSDSVNDDCWKYISAYIDLQEAQAKFEKAKQEFSTTHGGETLQKLLIPQKGPLPIEDVMTSEDVDALTKLVGEAIGIENEILSVKPSVVGYNLGVIEFIFKKDISVKQVELIKYKDYEWSKLNYDARNSITFANDITKKVVFVKKGGNMYAPFRMEDYNEITRK